MLGDEPFHLSRPVKQNAFTYIRPGSQAATSVPGRAAVCPLVEKKKVKKRWEVEVHFLRGDP